MYLNFYIKFYFYYYIFQDGSFLRNKMHGSGWWKFPHGKVRPGEWKDGVLIKWTGPEQLEAQVKAERVMTGKLIETIK